MRNLRRSITLFLAAGLLAGSLNAQELEEIVVTAERRSENLQEVPNAITALSRLTIEQADIHDLTDIATRVPGLTFSPFSPGQNIVALRGASSNDDGAGTDNSVAVFVDDVYLGRVSNINPEMFDLERVEVLRGPSGDPVRQEHHRRRHQCRVHAPQYGRGGRQDPPERRQLCASGHGRPDHRAGRKRLGGQGVVQLPQTRRLGRQRLPRQETEGRRRQGVPWPVAVRRRGPSRPLLSADFNQLDIEDMARTPIATGEPGDPAFWAAPVPGSYADLCAGRGADCSAGPIDGYAKRDAWGLERQSSAGAGQTAS